MEKEALLGEVEDILRTMPPRETLRHNQEENFEWLGRVSAFIEAWNLSKGIPLGAAIDQFHGRDANSAREGLRKILTLLYQARTDLRMQTIGPLNEAMGQGQIFDYFDEIRKIIEPSKNDILFIDPYLDAEFVSRYLPHVRPEVTIRLLAREKLNTLMPALETYVQQSGANVYVRTAAGFHDRYIIVDGNSCYQSGASFKDGAKKSPTTLTQITDAFSALQKTYEDIWDKANIER